MPLTVGSLVTRYDPHIGAPTCPNLDDNAGTCCIGEIKNIWPHEPTAEIVWHVTCVHHCRFTRPRGTASLDLLWEIGHVPTPLPDDPE